MCGWPDTTVRQKKASRAAHCAGPKAVTPATASASLSSAPFARSCSLAQPSEKSAACLRKATRLMGASNWKGLPSCSRCRGIRRVEMLSSSANIAAACASSAAAAAASPAPEAPAARTRKRSGGTTRQMPASPATAWRCRRYSSGLRNSASVGWKVGASRTPSRGARSDWIEREFCSAHCSARCSSRDMGCSCSRRNAASDARSRRRARLSFGGACSAAGAPARAAPGAEGSGWRRP
mmetsp:Transcript_5132/g.13354  ORF Transcript_5132/g.13354 Transcript_5132/m.13354 type:complete len:237 (+) Transcript_5132:74-784(+)